MATSRREEFRSQAFAEASRDDNFKRWIEARSDTIRNGVSVYDVLSRNGVSVRHDGREEQISCPFHGQDSKPSARVYPDTVRGSSHVWCFVCQERWDAIGLWRKYSGADLKYTRILSEMERAFGIIPLEAPPDPKFEEDAIDPELIEVDNLFEVCESRLKRARACFDMKGYLTIGSILDRLQYQVSAGSMSPSKAKPVLKSVLQKIGEKVR